MSQISESLTVMTAEGGRVKVHDAQAVFKLPKAVKALVAEIAAGQSKSEGAIYREAMAEYLTRRGYNR